MTAWPAHPLLYELNTWAWLDDLGRAHRRQVTLATVPEETWDALAALGLDAVWLMGVWERSPVGRAISLGSEGLLRDFRQALPDFSEVDDVGSPYCIRRYVVDAHLGGPEGLAAARAALQRRGIRLILDFVPNHVAPDHPWVAAHPERFVQGSAEDALSDPTAFAALGGRVFAKGRDPFFPAWPDVLQLNAFDPGLRTAVVATLDEVAAQCDGVRCDMAMLLLNDVFQRTWGTRVGARPVEDFWAQVIPAVQASHPGFRFLAEAYWDLEWTLQQQGFDGCYDKRLYDRLEHGDAEPVRQHLLADDGYQRRMVRFIENHDEPRAAAAFPGRQGWAAAAAILTLPGIRLLHEGQLEGRKARSPVFLARRLEEPDEDELAAFYRRLLQATRDPLFREGEWRLCERSGWPGHQGHRALLAWCWTRGVERALVVINYGAAVAQGRVRWPWDGAGARNWLLEDALSGERYQRAGDELQDLGLYVELPPWGCHLLRLSDGR
jgi:glycosidase